MTASVFLPASARTCSTTVVQVSRESAALTGASLVVERVLAKDPAGPVDFLPTTFQMQVVDKPTGNAVVKIGIEDEPAAAAQQLEIRYLVIEPGLSRL